MIYLCPFLNKWFTLDTFLMPVIWVVLIHFWLTYVFQTRTLDETMYPVHERTESGNILSLFLEIPEVSFIITSFQMYYIRIFSFNTGLSRTPMNIWDSQSVNGSLMAHLTDKVWRSEPPYLGEPARIHIIQISIYKAVHCFTEPSKGTVWFLVGSGAEPISFI